MRAIAEEVIEAEGPIHLDRLAQLVAASFGVQKLHSKRAAKIVYQTKAAGFTPDRQKFVWPDGLDPQTWKEFRPNSSQIDRPFTQISPVEIANALVFLRSLNPNASEEDLDRAVLKTFGRSKRTKQFIAHLAKAKPQA